MNVDTILGTMNQYQVRYLLIECLDRAHQERTASGTSYWGISDRDMLTCQLSLPKGHRKLDRVSFLERAMQGEDRDV